MRSVPERSQDEKIEPFQFFHRCGTYLAAIGYISHVGNPVTEDRQLAMKHFNGNEGVAQQLEVAPYLMKRQSGGASTATALPEDVGEYGPYPIQRFPVAIAGDGLLLKKIKASQFVYAMNMVGMRMSVKDGGKFFHAVF